MARIEIVPPTVELKPVLARLLELYAHDFSPYSGADVDDQGIYGYEYLDAYWTEPERHPFLLRVEGKWAGFALVRAGDPTDMAEFFVMRKYRRSGVGSDFARAVFARFPGRWQVREMRANEPAIAFWARAIPVPFTDAEWSGGPMQLFAIDAP